MGAIFDVPMLTNGIGGLFCRDGMVREIVAGFARRFPHAGGGLEGKHVALDANDGGDARAPRRAGNDRLRIED